METLRDSFKDIEIENKYKGWWVKSYMVEMTDGCQLETVVYFPSDTLSGSGEKPEMLSAGAEGTWPVLLTRTPYSHMRAYQEIHGEECAKLGMAFAYQFCRGTGESEGVYEPNIYERRDGTDTLNWLVDQPWCGPVGLHGSSYMALTCWIVADRLPDKVVGLFVSHYGVDRHLSAYEAGLFRHDILTGWAMGNCGLDIEPGQAYEELYMKAARYRPHVEADVNVWGLKLPWYRQWITQTDYDAPYWNEGFWQTLKQMPGALDKPVYIIAGWFDHHLKGTLLAYDLLNEDIKKKSRLLVGGWNHFFQPTTGAHEKNHGAINLNKTMFEWFQALIKGEATQTGISHYAIGSDDWHELQQVEEEASQESENGDEHVSMQVFGLSEAKNYDGPGVNEKSETVFSLKKISHRDRADTEDKQADDNHVLSYTYDPENPVMSMGGETLFVSEKRRGCQEQESMGLRDDILHFVSEPFERDQVIEGSIIACLRVETDVEDTCFTIKVSDLFPDGSAYNIRNGLTTLAYRNGAKHRLTYEPGTEIEIEIPCLPTLWTMKKGHRLRVDISSSNFPEYAIHPNVPGVWSEIKETRIAHQMIKLSLEGASSIHIPMTESR